MTRAHCQIVVTLDGDLEVGQRATLVERLQRIYGVVEARFDSSDYRRLTVTFRHGSLSSPTLLDYLATQNAAASAAESRTQTSQPDVIVQTIEATHCEKGSPKRHD